jgi:outer membrane receptor protein involved in Fe transport
MRASRIARRGACAAALALPAFAASTSAQDTASERARDSTRATVLAPVTVTATRERAIAPPVTTADVPPELLRRTPATDPYDLVRRAAGIEVHEQGQGPGFASDAVLRGFTSDHSSDVLLVVDGMPINLPVHGHVEGYADWSILSPAAVSSLRVIHGPASPLYGDFSLGGVVEIVTAPDASDASGALSGSNYGDAGGWIRTGRRLEHGGFLLALDGRRAHGWRDNSSYWLGNGLVRGWHRVGKGRIEGGFAAYGSTWDSPGFVPVARYNSGDLESATDPTDGGDARRFMLQGRYGLPLTESTTIDLSAWGQLVRSAVYLNIPENGVVRQTEERDRRGALGGQLQVAHHTVPGELSGGLTWRADGATYDLFETAARAREAEEQADDGRYLAGGAFVRWRGLLGTRLVYDVGGRLDAIRYGGLDRLAGSPWAHATDAVASPKIGARYLLGDRVALLGSFSRGFRGAVGVIGDPARPLVKGWAKELGAAYDDGGIHLQAALFQTDVSDERILDPVTREVSAAGRSRRRGASLEVRVKLGEAVHILGEATFNDATVTGVDGTGQLRIPPSSLALGPVLPDGSRLKPSFHDVPLSPGDKVPGVARYFGRLGVESALTDRLAARVLWRVNGPYTPIGEPGVRTQEYGVVDAGFSFAVHPAGPTVDVDLLNVLDARYPELRASGFVNPGAPRTLRMSVRFAGQS